MIKTIHVYVCDLCGKDLTGTDTFEGSVELFLSTDRPTKRYEICRICALKLYEDFTKTLKELEEKNND